MDSKDKVWAHVLNLEDLDGRFPTSSAESTHVRRFS